MRASAFPATGSGTQEIERAQPLRIPERQTRLRHQDPEIEPFLQGCRLATPEILDVLQGDRPGSRHERAWPARMAQEIRWRHYVDHLQARQRRCPDELHCICPVQPAWRLRKVFHHVGDAFDEHRGAIRLESCGWRTRFVQGSDECAGDGRLTHIGSIAYDPVNLR